MKKKRPIRYAEFRAFLQTLGYAEKHVPDARVLKHPEEGLLIFRYYRDDEPVLARDLQSTRTFLDLRGVIEADDYDAQLLRANTPA
jgi:hypothetical protein